MYEGAVVLACVAVACGLGSGAYVLTKRQSTGWSTNFDVGGGLYRGGRLQVATTEPLAVRLGAGASVFAAGVSLIRGGLALNDVMDLVDEPHRQIGMVPQSNGLAILTVLYGLVSLAAAGMFVYGAWVARRPEGARRAWTGLAAMSLLPFACTHAWLVNATCTSIYWTTRMIVLSASHAVLLLPPLALSFLAATAARA